MVDALNNLNSWNFSVLWIEMLLKPKPHLPALKIRAIYHFHRIMFQCRKGGEAWRPNMNLLSGNKAYFFSLKKCSSSSVCTTIVNQKPKRNPRNLVWKNPHKVLFIPCVTMLTRLKTGSLTALLASIWGPYNGVGWTSSAWSNI